LNFKLLLSAAVVLAASALGLIVVLQAPEAQAVMSAQAHTERLQGEETGMPVKLREGQ
jgi:hypothetical protein